MTLRRAVALFAVTLACAACGRSKPSRVIVLGLDGMDPRTVDLLMSEGKMPNFAKLRKEGAYAPLLSAEPLLSPVVWTTIATGKGPDQHRIGHFVAVNEKGDQLPVTSAMRKVKALWNILSDAGRRVAVLGWWATWPSEKVNGAIVSDHFAYHFLFGQGLHGDTSAEGKTWPPELVDKLQPLVKRPQDLKPADLAPFVSVSPQDFDRPFDLDDELSGFKWALSTTMTYRNVGLELWKNERPDTMLACFEATDATAHLFGHLFRASVLSGDLAEQQKRYGGAVEAMYAYSDRIVGDFLAAADDDTTLIVLSDHGFDLGALPDDPSKLRNMRRVSEEFHRVQGIVYMWGRHIKARTRLDRPSILDIAPTVLALNGVAPARDMPGRVLSEALDIKSPTRVASYEPGGGGTRRGLAGGPRSPEEAAEPRLSADPIAVGRPQHRRRPLRAGQVQGGGRGLRQAGEGRAGRRRPADEPGRRAGGPGPLRRGALGDRRGHPAPAAQPRGLPQPRGDPRAEGRRRRRHRRLSDGPPLSPRVHAVPAGAAPSGGRAGEGADAHAAGGARAGAGRGGQPAGPAWGLPGRDGAPGRGVPPRPAPGSRVSVPLERGLPHRRHSRGRRGPEEGPGDRAGQRPLPREPQQPPAAEDALKTRAPDLAVALVLAVGVFAVYALGACRTIYVGDSGELVTAVAVLGIPHPSGYPLYVLLGKLWTLLVPAGSLAFRMSLFSAFCGALACGVLYRLARATGLGTAAAVFSSLLLAFSPTFWAEANVQRVYALNALFVAWATLLAVRWDAADPDRRRRLFVTTLFVAGLGATNHTFMAVWTIAFVLFAVLTRRDLIEQPKLLAAGVAALAAGLLPYLYLPIRSRQDPVLDWGNPESLGTLVDVVTRRDFWERRFLEGPADLVPITADFVGGIGQEIGLAGALLALLGAVAAMRTTRRRLIVLPALVVLGNLAALALHGSRSDIFIWHRYAIPSYVMLAWVAGWGAALVMARLPARAGLLLLAVPAVMLVRGFPDQDRSRYRIAEDFSRTLLKALPPGAHLAASDDNILFVLMYLHLAEDVRPDVDLILQGVGGGSLPPLRFDPDSDPLFFTDHPNWNNPQLELLPTGLAFRVWRRERPAPPGTVPKERLEGELDPRVPKDYLTQNLIGQFHYMLANTLERSDWPRARREYGEAMRSAPHNDVLFFNLGLIFGASGLYDEAIAAFRRSAEINPRAVAGPGRLKASDRVPPLESERRRIAALEADLVADDRLTGIVPRSTKWHRRMAELLRMRGERAAARGHELRALEAEVRP